MTATPIDHRYRLVPTKRGPDGWYRSWRAGDVESARASAQEFFEEEGVPVLVCDLRSPASVGNFTVGKVPKPEKKKAA